MADSSAARATATRRADGDCIAIPLPPGAAVEGRLELTPAEAEQLHARLCYALSRQPASRGAPECRQSVQYGHSNRPGI